MTKKKKPEERYDIMKKIIIVLIVLMFATCGYCADNINCFSVYSGTISASGSDSVTVSKGSEGYFSIQPIFTGTGVLKISYQVSNNGSTWSPAVQIVAAAVSGTVYPYPASGVNIFAGYQRLVFTETGTANPVVISAVHRCAQ